MSSHVTTSFQVGFGVPGGDATAIVLAVLLLAALVLGLRPRAVQLWQRLVLALLRVLSALLAFVLLELMAFIGGVAVLLGVVMDVDLPFFAASEE